MKFEINNLDNAKIVNPKEYYARLAIAYKNTNDPKLKRFLLEQIKQRVATIRK